MRVEVGAQAEVEVGLALARHRRGEVEDAVEAFLAERLALAGEGADARLDARVRGQLGARRHLVGEHQLLDAPAAETCRARAGRRRGASR